MSTVLTEKIVTTRKEHSCFCCFEKSPKGTDMRYQSGVGEDGDMIKDCPFLNRNVKLLPCQKERVLRLWGYGMTQISISRMFGVSRPLITYIVDPEQMEKNLEKRKEKGGKYYNTQSNSRNIRGCRAYKKALGMKRMS